MFKISELIGNFFKGFAMGAANVIPGISGGTIALITNIFERLVNSIKSFNIKSFKLLFKGQFNEFIKATDLIFLGSVVSGMIISIFSFAFLLEFLFERYPTLVWAFFFGLILASIYFIIKTIDKWNFGVIIFFIIGAAIAASISFLTPASENSEIWYLFICGLLGLCGMILPGLSGSFILVLMGNYELIVTKALTNFDLSIIIPVGIGGVIGILGFAHLLSWIYKKYKDLTISILCGFIFGSLGVLWPWKTQILGNIGNKEKIIGYKWNLPDFSDIKTYYAFIFIILGISTLTLIEIIARKRKAKKLNKEKMENVSIEQ